MDNAKRKANVALLSVISNTTLVLLKLAIGLFIGSVSVISEAIHSGVDLLAAIIAWIAVRTSGQPADKEHPFGHGKVENISGTVEAILIFFAAAWIIFEAVKKLLHPEPLGAVGWGVGVMLASALANMMVSHRLFKVGKETDSVALQADAWHLRTDVYTSAGVMGGLALMWLAEAVFKGVHFHWLDPVAAILVALLIIKAAYHLTMESARDLLDVSLPEDEENWIRDYIRSYSPSVRGFHHLRTRKAGSDRFIEFHMRVSSGMSVEESHQITEDMTCDIRNRYTGSTVTIHIEPCHGDCAPRCIENCLLDDGERSLVSRKA
ncbi:MAG: cation diffusion facilitator family transporter [Armatimonadota bacterium]|nr:cation diffusion facilitator family transporter [bacterium]